ncbi:hypothetical protein [Fodinicurvata sp. EGI_FJ10296]|uniref:hypothetical protein n=1 Tax=Fodinicurvata sp. EGI_FJ10296 TaxID=3231908 RepID=UPI0034528BEE
MTFLTAVTIVADDTTPVTASNIIINPSRKSVSGPHAIMRACHNISVPDGEGGDFCDAAKCLDAVLTWLPDAWSAPETLGFIEALAWARHEKNIRPLQIIRRNQYRLPVAWNADADDLADRFKKVPADEAAEFLAAVFRLFLIVDDPVAVLEPLLIDDMPIDPAALLDYAPH